MGETAQEASGIRARIGRRLARPEESPLDKLLLAPLLPLEALYRGAVAARAALRRPASVPCGVVSIGNLTVGGTGKTPTTIAIAGTLRDAGLRVVVLSRGYRGRAGREVGVVSEGREPLISADEAGDEPVMMARRLRGVPVLVARRRIEGARVALERYGAEVVVLDDAFQHRALARDIDFVVLCGDALFGNGHCLPRGPLREPPAALRRAQAVLVNGAGPDERARAEASIRRINAPIEIFHGALEAIDLVDLGAGVTLPTEALRGKRIAAFAGIVDPSRFFALLRRLGARVAMRRGFEDHHSYAESDIAPFGGGSDEWDAVVTTEKDAVKLQPGWVSGKPLLALRVGMRVEEPERLRSFVLRHIGRPSGGGS